MNMGIISFYQEILQIRIGLLGLLRTETLRRTFCLLCITRYISNLHDSSSSDFNEAIKITILHWLYEILWMVKLSPQQKDLRYGNPNHLDTESNNQYDCVEETALMYPLHS